MAYKFILKQPRILTALFDTYFTETSKLSIDFIFINI